MLFAPTAPSVNIDDRHWKHWYRLAMVKYRMAEYEAALVAVKQSLQREQKNEASHCIWPVKYMKKRGYMQRLQQCLRPF